MAVPGLHTLTRCLQGFTHTYSLFTGVYTHLLVVYSGLHTLIRNDSHTFTWVYTQWVYAGNGKYTLTRPSRVYTHLLGAADSTRLRRLSAEAQRIGAVESAQNRSGEPRAPAPILRLCSES